MHIFFTCYLLRMKFNSMMRYCLYRSDLVYLLISVSFIISSTEATFGHEHVHIRVHVPEVTNEVHHKEKTIIKEIPIIHHRYKEPPSYHTASGPDEDDDEENFISHRNIKYQPHSDEFPGKFSHTSPGGGVPLSSYYRTSNTDDGRSLPTFYKKSKNYMPPGMTGYDDNFSNSVGSTWPGTDDTFQHPSYHAEDTASSMNYNHFTSNYQTDEVSNTDYNHLAPFKTKSFSVQNYQNPSYSNFKPYSYNYHVDSVEDGLKYRNYHSNEYGGDSYSWPMFSSGTDDTLMHSSNNVEMHKYPFDSENQYAYYGM